ncbi:MAG: hypothetical protein AAGF10_04365, partial [Verrucomicrobiota bacterium]
MNLKVLIVAVFSIFIMLPNFGIAAEGDSFRNKIFGLVHGCGLGLRVTIDGETNGSITDSYV